MVQDSPKQIEAPQAPHYALLVALYDLYCENGKHFLEHLWLEDAAPKAGLQTWPEIMSAASYLSKKKFIEDFNPVLQVYVKLTVRGIEFVEKCRNPKSKDRVSTSRPTSIVVHGNVIGGIQSNSPNSTQAVSVTLTKVDESIKQLGDLVSRSSASELDKEEAVAALERVRTLTTKAKSAEVIAKANEKLDLVKKTIGTAVELSKIAAPYITLLGEYFAK